MFFWEEWLECPGWKWGEKSGKKKKKAFTIKGNAEKKTPKNRIALWLVEFFQLYLWKRQWTVGDSPSGQLLLRYYCDQKHCRCGCLWRELLLRIICNGILLLVMENLITKFIIQMIKKAKKSLMAEFVKWCINHKYQYLSNACASLGHIECVTCDLSGLK